MANTNGSWGLKPVAKMGQNSNSTGVTGYTTYEIANANSNVIYQGTPVIPLSTGYIDIIGSASGGSVGLLGSFQGCRYVSSTTGKPTWSMYWPGSGADSNHPIRCFVADDPMQIFSIATDATLAVSTIAATKTLNLRILGWEEDSASEDFAAAGIAVLVRLNNHFNSANGAIVAGTTDTAGV